MELLKVKNERGSIESVTDLFALASISRPTVSVHNEPVSTISPWPWIEDFANVGRPATWWPRQGPWIGLKSLRFFTALQDVDDTFGIACRSFSSRNVPALVAPGQSVSGGNPGVANQCSLPMLTSNNSFC